MRVAAAAAAAALLLAGCTSEDEQPQPSPSPAPPASASPAGPVAQGYSTPVEDRVYPDIGDPGVDALHYDLHLTWTPQARHLDAVETLRLRATADDDHLQLDLAEPLEVTRLTVDDRPASYDHHGKDLVVDTDVTRDREYTLVIHYAGSPQPVPAPVQRTDFDSTGWTVTEDGSVWTMQEPYGAYSWYAVNDQPSDKALYDVTISAPAPMVGVSNGKLLSRAREGPDTVTHWRLDEPAASYLVTVAIGDLTMTEDRSASGLPITYWTPADRPDLLRRVRRTPEALAFDEERLGPFPFDSLGILVVDSRSGMETQTMITLGDTKYDTAPETLVHEIAHQWYGDEVTPVDWRDMWMNEGMATYVQALWMSEQGDQGLAQSMDYWASLDARLRSEAGPPADPHPDSFGSGNVYYIPAVMWDRLRRKIGDEEFWRLVAEWPTVHQDGNADYDDITSWWSDRTGEDLSDFFESWLLADTPPSG